MAAFTSVSLQHRVVTNVVISCPYSESSLRAASSPYTAPSSDTDARDQEDITGLLRWSFARLQDTCCAKRPPFEDAMLIRHRSVGSTRCYQWILIRSSNTLVIHSIIQHHTKLYRNTASFVKSRGWNGPLLLLSKAIRKYVSITQSHTHGI